MAQPVLWDSMALAGAAVGAARWEGVCRTCLAQSISKLAWGLCPPKLVLQPWQSLPWGFEVLHGRLGTTGLGGDGSLTGHEMEKGDVRAWDGSCWVGVLEGTEIT